MEKIRAELADIKADDDAGGDGNGIGAGSGGVRSAPVPLQALRGQIPAIPTPTARRRLGDWGYKGARWIEELAAVIF